MNAGVAMRIESYRKRLGQLVGSPPRSISEFVHTNSEFLQRNEGHDRPGVYAISRPDTDEIVYVGGTRTKGIWRRIGDHQTGGASSDLPDMLKRSPQLPQDANAYRVRYVVIKEDRDRLFFEHFAIGALAPELNK
jgi:hypothetical protein